MSATTPNSRWICEACMLENKRAGRECQMCGAIRSKRQAIGSPEAIDAPPGPSSAWICQACTYKNMWQVRYCEQCNTTRSKRQAVGGWMAIEAPPVAVMAAVESACLQPPPNNVHPPGIILDIIGTAGIDRGRNYKEHTCCGDVLQEDVVVRIRKEQILVPDNMVR